MNRLIKWHFGIILLEILYVITSQNGWDNIADTKKSSSQAIIFKNCKMRLPS